MSSKDSRPTGSARAERCARNAAQRSRAVAKERASRNKWRTILAGAAIVLIIAVMVVARTLQGGRGVPSESSPVSPTVLQALSSVPTDVSNQIGQGTAQGSPVPVRAQVLRGPRGLPEIVYIGANYCPYCAAERWGLIVALSRFGTFSNLHTARSAADDVFPSTPTFTFYGSTYQSSYVELSAVELQSSTKVGSTYQTLQTPTPEQQRLLDQYDAPPYVSSSSAGAIPFIDIANRYIVSGSNFSPELLDNHSWDSIASNLKDPNSDQAKAIVGTANVITAAVCNATGGSPASVCGQPAIKQIEASQSKIPAPGGSG